MKLKIGDKVIIKSKYGLKRNLKISNIYKEVIRLNQQYAYIVDINNISKLYIINTYMDELKSGDYFKENDVESYIRQERIEKLKKIERTR